MSYIFGSSYMYILYMHARIWDSELVKRLYIIYWGLLGLWIQNGVFDKMGQDQDQLTGPSTVVEVKCSKKSIAYKTIN